MTTDAAPDASNYPDVPERHEITPPLRKYAVSKQDALPDGFRGGLAGAGVDDGGPGCHHKVVFVYSYLPASARSRHFGDATVGCAHRKRGCPNVTWPQAQTSVVADGAFSSGGDGAWSNAV